MNSRAVDHRQHVVIIGAGIVGLACAFHALQQGLRVTIVEPGVPGHAHASSYGNAGWLSSHSVIPPASPGVWKQIPGWLVDPLGPLTVRWRHLPTALPWLMKYLGAAWTYAQIEQTAKALRAMLRDAPDCHLTMATAAGVPHLIQKKGLLHVYPTRDDFEKDRRAWQIRQAEGVTWQELSDQALWDHEPQLDRRYRLGLFVPDVGNCINPGEYVAALMQHVADQGVVAHRAQATGFRFRDKRLVAITTSDGEILCDKAVIAAGARAKTLAAAAGDRVSLETERGYHAVVQTDAIGPQTPTMLMDQKVIVTRMTNGLRIAGQVEIAALDDTPNWRRAEILRTLLVSSYPQLASVLAAEQIDVWMGRRPSTPDGLPCIGPASASLDVIHAYGHGHVGLAGSARTGQVVAQLLAGHPTGIDLRPFSPQRFH
jgi:D-amino-acid dehydrogenase